MERTGALWSIDFTLLRAPQLVSAARNTDCSVNYINLGGAAGRPLTSKSVSLLCSVCRSVLGQDTEPQTASDGWVMYEK